MVLKRDHEGAALPTIDVNGTTLDYDDTRGSGEPVVFVDRTAFEIPVLSFGRTHRVVAYDHRDADNDTLYEDAAALIEALSLGPCHFVGNDVGGFVALRLVARRPELLRSAAIFSSSADEESVLGELVGTTVPLLVVSAATDTVHPPELSRRVADTAANARHVTIKRARPPLTENRPDVVSVLLEQHFEAV
jgi:3-oxoadipate enol-lactonase